MEIQRLGFFNFKLFVFFLLLSLNKFSMAQNMKINFNDGTNITFSLEEVRTILFDSYLIRLTLEDGGEYLWNASTVSNYLYSDLTVNTEQLNFQKNKLVCTIFPNPVTNNINISLFLPNENQVTFKLLDLKGNVYMEKELLLDHEEHITEKLYLDGLASGTYECLITGKYISFTKKIIKL
jgi:hypothetical protein